MSQSRRTKPPGPKTKSKAATKRLIKAIEATTKVQVAHIRDQASRRPKAKPSKVIRYEEDFLSGRPLPDLSKLAAEFDREFPEMKSNRSEVFIVVGLALLAATAAALFFGLS